MSTAKLEHAIARAFPSPEYATFFEVADATGSRQTRWADAVSMAIWPSRGLLIWGFEIKASRSDWLREKKNPLKSCAVQQFCDRWAVVTVPGVVADGELPETWGLAELHGSKLVWKVPAPKLEPADISRNFMAAVLRRAGALNHRLVSEAIEERVKTDAENLEKRIQSRAEQITRNSAEAERAVKQFEEASGVRIHDYNAQGVGAALKALYELRSTDRHMSFEHEAKRLRGLAEKLEVVSRELSEVTAMQVDGV